MAYVRILPEVKKSGFNFKEYLESVKSKLEDLINKVHFEHLPELMALVREVLGINHVNHLGRLQKIDREITSRPWRYR
ncbi:hypothetical protein GCM10011450_15710 [Advenella faeciporci]|uniref:Uncharacterized protein n=1 Tax=Advenella faeciporci TaxID=797535 RepID=A0A918JKY8_9BURK|nr:hypothetical protein [Advenella faeciporci]GGW86650.1 hypothetical protein GCM10011450_15710 [Advenella faeciporci]